MVTWMTVFQFTACIVEEHGVKNKSRYLVFHWEWPLHCIIGYICVSNRAKFCYINISLQP